LAVNKKIMAHKPHLRKAQDFLNDYGAAPM